jgi:hypothetical protein
LVFGTPKILAILSYKYARVLEKIYTEDAQHASTCLLRRRVCYFVPFVVMHWRSGEQVSGTSSSAILHRERANKIFGKRSARLLERFHIAVLLVSGARLGVVKRAEVLIIAVVFFTWLFRSGKKLMIFCP